jgi:hypothetical protein
LGMLRPMVAHPEQKATLKTGTSSVHFFRIKFVFFAVFKHENPILYNRLSPPL